MSIKKSLKNLKNLFRPDKNENLLILEVIIIGSLIYYSLFFTFPKNDIINLIITGLLIIYIFLIFTYYLIEKDKIFDYGFQNQFYIFSQKMFSIFLGVLLCPIYLLYNSKELINLLICSIPLISFIIIELFQRISSHQIEKFLKKYIIKAEIWNELDIQTKKDFKQAEANMRAENIPNAIINLSKGLERELKLTIFQPFKLVIKEQKNKGDYFKLLTPFASHGSDPRERTYQNFKNYLENKRHLTLGNIPFFLLNLTDKKIGRNTVLFTKFSQYLKTKFKDKYSNIIEISKTLFNHDFFSIPGIKISDLRNEAAHPQKKIDENGTFITDRSNEILSIDNYISLLKVLSVKPNLLELVIDLKKEIK